MTRMNRLIFGMRLVQEEEDEGVQRMSQDP
jgi:hypothetical protein